MLALTIADCMNKDFAQIRPDLPVVEAASKLIKKETLGGPVTDEKGVLLGWISEQECLQVAIQVLYYNQRVATVQDIMRTDVLTVSLKDDLMLLVQQILQQKPKNYPVIDENRKVLGVVSRRNILKTLDKHWSK